MLPELLDIAIGLIVLEIVELIKPFVVFIGPLHARFIPLRPFKRKESGTGALARSAGPSSS